MKIIDFNADWYWKRLDEEGEGELTTLPHDAMITEKRTAGADSGTNAGWVEGRDYEYVKTFDVPAEYADKILTLEFEGVYHNAEVYVNGKKAAYRPYGYTNFYVPLDGFVKTGRNTVRVIARNADQPNSRWYSGAGIYRPVKLYVADKKHILINGLRVRTISLDPVVAEVTVRTSEPGDVSVTVEKDGVTVASLTGTSDKEAVFAVELAGARLWSPDHPELYTVRAKFGEDEAVTTTGFRVVTCDSTNGFRINGERVIIRGACIHHDNGILGARCYEEAERRKIRLLKAAGYNAVRSAHNPCSKALLDACDEYGVMMMDEYVDMWYIPKTKYDYARYINDWYEQDITDMVEKDYNHPSVVMYSFGNEVAETGQERGIEFFKKMRDLSKKLDPDRPTTVGINIFFNYLHAKGFGVYNEKTAEKNPQKKVGSEFFNVLAGKLGAGFMKTMAKLPGCDRKTRDAFAAMDVAGYNYGIKRYKGDLKKYPDRVILGSETFCADAYAFWELAKKNNALIGDFVWAGIDYLGEVGIGTREYRDYAPDYLHGLGWVSAGSGRLDLTGRELGEALYTKVAFELTDKPAIAVIPVNHTHDSPSPSCWKFTNAFPSWSWNGCDGNDAKVEVYSRAPVVKLLVNGKQVGQKKLGKNCRFEFRTKYYGGEVTAVACDADGNELSRSSLRTAGDETVLSVRPEERSVPAGKLAFVRLDFTDNAGEIKPLERADVKVEVENGELVALGNACPYNPRGYASDVTDTYYGSALAVVRVGEKGSTVVKATGGDMKGVAVIDID